MNEGNRKIIKTSKELYWWTEANIVGECFGKENIMYTTQLTREVAEYFNRPTVVVPNVLASIERDRIPLKAKLYKAFMFGKMFGELLIEKEDYERRLQQ